MIDADSRGLYVISVTPFHDNGAVDFESLDRVTDFYLEAGATGITILGMMGEAPKLSQAEARDIARRVIQRAGTAPIVVGVSSPSFVGIGELGKAVMDMGAAGVMIAPPNMLRTDQQILGYYRQSAQVLGKDVPICLQDFPLATTVQISDELLGRIVDEVPEVVMLKHEDWPGLDKISALRAAEARGRRRISVLCGNGGLFLPEEMARGADGAMTGYGYPEMLAMVCRSAAGGDPDHAQDVFDAHLPLMRYEQQPGAGLAVRKYVLARRGAIASAAIRKPGGPLNALAVAEVERLIRRQEARLAALE